MRVAAGIATAHWSGRAQQAFSDYAAQLSGIFDANSRVIADAGRLLERLATALQSAQSITRQAAADCEHWQQKADAHPHAAAHAQQQVEQAQASGQQAWSEYSQLADRAKARLATLQDQLEHPRQPPGASHLLLQVTAADQRRGWELLPGLLESVEHHPGRWKKDPGKVLRQLNHGKPLTPHQALALTLAEQRYLNAKPGHLTVPERRASELEALGLPGDATAGQINHAVKQHYEDDEPEIDPDTGLPWSSRAIGPPSLGAEVLAGVLFGVASGGFGDALETGGLAAGGATEDVEGLLSDAAAEARAEVGDGRGAVYGTRVHTAFANIVDSSGSDDLSTEISYSGGIIVRRGTPGSIRLDVVVGPEKTPRAIYDLKTGSAELTPARIAQIRANLPPRYKDIPIVEIRP